MVSADSKLGGAVLDSPSEINDWLSALHVEGATERDLLLRAYRLAEQAHADQTRISGEPYIHHALAVADILAGLRMDTATLAAAILHDVVEDTAIDLPQIELEFGPEVARLVDGVTKMSLIDYQGDSERGRKERLHAESLRKLLLAMAEDVRVVLIKLADRLHNMRTLHVLPPAKQRRIARETLDIYAPLANRLGIWQVKWELEDLAFRHLEPEAYRRIARFLDERRVDRELYIQRLIETLMVELKKVGVQAEVSGRPKHIYSIWRKMSRKGLSFEQLYDIRAVRVLVREVADCYAALGVVHTLWRHIPREFDDYIATPKENNYQSIHTAVVGPEGKTLEVQIRTRAMHEHAELGVAAHWRYKEGRRHDPGYEQKIAWLRQLLEWKEESSDTGDFIDRFKSEVFEDRVYVLTPQGDIIDLQLGSTPLDFAYHVHTEIGHRCRGAKVNGRIVPLTYELKSGEQVEVLTTKNGGPSRDWLNPQLGYLKTSRARAKARHWFKQQDTEKALAAGRVALERELHRLGVVAQSYEQLAARFHFKKVDDFLAAIGRGEITPAQIANAAHALHPPKTSAPLEPSAPRRRSEETGKDEVYIQGVGNLLTRLARCCKPAPGDAIIGFITRGHGVTVHRHDCPNVLKMPESKQSRLVEVEWGTSAGSTYPVDIEVQAIDRQGLLRDISALLSNEKVNVIALNTQTNARTHTARMRITLELRDIEQLSRVLNRLSQLPNVTEVYRQVH